MTRKDVLEFVGRNPVSMMATVDAGRPRVRGISTPVVDGEGLVFCMGARKGVCRELLADPAVELCYWSPEERTQIRIRGAMTPIEDEALKKRIVETVFTFLQPVVEEHGWGALTLFRLGSGTASAWGSDPTASEPEIFDF